MDYTQAVSYMESLKSAGMQMGLERMQHAAELLGHPETSFRAVHIAGTNGKGSTACMIEAMCRASKHKTGSFTSPFLASPREAIRIDGQILSEEAFARCASMVRDAVPNGLSEYEFLTTVAFCAFREHRVELAVVECCLGGATDTTNILPPPLCAVFTPIALDHTAILGNTVAAIAFQKGGIIKAPCDVVCAASMNEEALGSLYERAAANGVPVFQPSASAVQVLRVDRHGILARCNGTTLTLSMCGSHQLDNALTALTVIDRLQEKGISIDRERAIEALGAVTLPCRQEILCTDPFLLVDGAHNPHGIRALASSLREMSVSDITLVIGMLADKEVDTCLALLAPLCRRIVCTTPAGTPRAMPSQELALLAKAHHDHVVESAHPVDAFCLAQELAEGGAIVVGGSFYTASVVRAHIKKESLTER